MEFKKWSIWRANLDPVVGSEQGKSRPVLIISEDDINALLNVVNIIPLTSKKSGRTIYPNEVLINADKCGLENESIALCHQIPDYRQAPIIEKLWLSFIKRAAR